MKTRFIFTLCYAALSSMFGCFDSPTRNGKDSDVITVIDGFNRFNKSTLDKYDSCVFVNSVESEIEIDGRKVILDEIVVRNFTSSLTEFSYSVVEFTNGKAHAFFGAFDIFRMMFGSESDSSRVIEVPATPLEAIINSAFDFRKFQSDQDAEKKIQTIIHTLYTERVDGMYLPIFSLTLPDEKVQESVIQPLYGIIYAPGVKRITFTNERLGTIIFAWHIVEGKLLLSEYIIPFHRLKYLKNDAIFSGNSNCDRIR